MKKADIDWGGETIYAVGAPNDRWRENRPGKAISYGWAKDRWGRNIHLSDQGKLVKVSIKNHHNDGWHDDYVPLSHIQRLWTEQEKQNAEAEVAAIKLAEFRTEMASKKAAVSQRLKAAAEAVKLSVFIDYKDNVNFNNNEALADALEELARLKEWRAIQENDGDEKRYAKAEMELAHEGFSD